MEQEITEIETPESPCDTCGNTRWALKPDFKATILGTTARITATCLSCTATITSSEIVPSEFGKLWTRLHELWSTHRARMASAEARRAKQQTRQPAQTAKP